MDLKPHRSRYWLAHVPDEQRESKIEEICQLYKEAPALEAAGARVLSIDEMTGVQALERLHPGMPMAPGKVECREFEYKRHGTLSFIVSFNVATGEVIHPTCGPTRTGEDFVQHIRQTVEQEPEVTHWHFVADNLNTHCSEALVRYVAAVSGDETELGMAGKEGILQSMKTRAAFLSRAEHKIVFHYTPKHASWLNQIEIWFSILTRKVLRRGNFCSTENLKEKVLAFVDYFNRTMARPFKWTYTGKVLVA